ncbi:hypothetical protein NHF45_13830 [Maricaulaceae bacterium NA33B04]|nr:hypothetical protein [Maricaulaceae bacterium NA33B04]
MARLSEKGESTFVILDHEPLYASEDIDQICAQHQISDTQRGALWRLLEKAGHAYLDQRRLSAAPTKLARVRQDLRLARQLAAQLAEMSPDIEQLSSDTPSIALSRAHLSALREGERKAGPAGGARLEDLRDALKWADSVYEAALDACGRQEEEPDEAWRITLTNFYTRELARSWTGKAGADGEAFLHSCRAPLERTEGAAGPPINAFDLASRA